MAAQKKYKYVNQRKKPNYDLYLRFETDKPKEVTLSSWEFTKDSYNESLCKCYISKEDGEKVDKIWSIWDYEFAEKLKKKLSGKNQMDGFTLTVVARENEDGESYLEFTEK